MNKIFIYALKHGPEYYDHALTDDGLIVACHISKSIELAKADMGIGTEAQHDLYREHFPNGYELVWIDSKDLDNHTEFQEAFAKHESEERVSAAVEAYLTEKGF
jgi:hypothetical protein